MGIQQDLARQLSCIAIALSWGALAYGDPVVGDFNGDGYNDVAIGVAHDNVNQIAEAGAVNVIYGSPEGLATVGNQWWHQASSGVLGTPESLDEVRVVACGDFNGDGFSDLAFGAYRDRVDNLRAGAVNVLYGSAAGLTAFNNQRWHQNSPDILGTAEADDWFGYSGAAGDFNGDGWSDLAIGVPGENVDGFADAGVVNVLYGSASGLSAAGNQRWRQNSPGVLGATDSHGEQFGSALAAGDFDGDGYQDLAIGVPRDSVGSVVPGSVNVLYGSAGGLTATGNQLWNRDSPGIPGASDGSAFGQALASGDLNGDDVDDLAIAAPQFGPATGPASVHVLYGFSLSGLESPGNQLFALDPIELVRMALAIGNFDNDPYDDLAIGLPWFPLLDNPVESGAVTVFFGSANGATETGAQLWTQASPSILGQREAGDRFGYSLASGDYDGNGSDDLAIGVPFDGLPGGIPEAGAINVLYGFATGLTSDLNQLWHQDSPGIAGTAEEGEHFGQSLGAGHE
jgi:hypothetical protein